MPRQALLIFDLDGTLFQAHTVTVPAVQKSLQELGLPAPPEGDIRSFFGKPNSEFHAWLRSLCPRERSAELVASVERVELELISETGELYAGVRDALTALQAMAGQMAICSNGPQDYVERVLSVHNLQHFFDAIRYRQFPHDNKPAMVRELLARLAGRPAFVIGDRHDDVEAAHQNGLLAIAATYGYGEAAELADADAVAASPLALPAIVQSFLVR